MSTNKNILMIQEVADGLGALKDQVVFIGGATVGLYITDPGSPDPTPSDDVDFIVEIANLGEYHRFEQQLRARGFKDFVGPGQTVICRKVYGAITVDVMPTDPTILGFPDTWYKEGIHHKVIKTLPNKVEVFILSLPYFLATKLEAFHSRGSSDLRFSHDIEDVLSVIDGDPGALMSISSAPESVKKFLKNSFNHLRQDELLLQEAAYGFLSTAGESVGRVSRLINIIKEISNIQ